LSFAAPSLISNSRWLLFSLTIELEVDNHVVHVGICSHFD
jgi:hypothetical protein